VNNRFLILALLLPMLPSPAQADDWPQWRGPARDGTWNESGILSQFAAGNIQAKWRAPVSSGYTGPTVASGRVYLMDRLTKPAQTERILCYNEESGDFLWSHEYAAEYRNVQYVAGPRASVIIHKNRAYALGTMGTLHCLDAVTGDLVWARDLNEEYAIRMPIWGIAASPLIEGDLLILQIGGSPDACILALDLATGVERWRALEDRPSYSAPIVIDQGDIRVLTVWTGDSVAGLNPATGAVLWKHPFPPSQMVIGIATPVVSGDRLLVSSFYDGSLQLNLEADPPGANERWHRKGPNGRNTDALHSLISTPLIEDGYIYGIDAYGHMRCLDLDTGNRVWEDTTAVPTARWSTAHFVQNDKTTWIFNERGELLLTRLSPQGLTILSRAKLIEPTRDQLNSRGGVTWSHPAFANGHIFIRNDTELICADLRADSENSAHE